MRIGAYYLDKSSCEFVVWAPFRNKVELKIVTHQEKIIPMEKDERGYWIAAIEAPDEEILYLYRIDSELERPDPASHLQPQGVHQPSQVVNHRSFKWEDHFWRGLTLSEMIMYELHVGTFTPEGTFTAIIPRLSELKDLGINTVDIMPVAQFPGERNWGYDGAYPFAVQYSYGGPDGLKKLVNECHKLGIAVILDVVYNHLGPEGNYFWDYGPYFTDKYRTPWGMAINFDDAYSNEVRNFFIENALHWFENYHIDGLRLDAIHGISDMSAKPFLQELAEKVEKYSLNKGKKAYLIAESDLNDSRAIKPVELGGFGLDAQWCDDFHHCIHTLITGERGGYYTDFGKTEHLVKSVREGFVYSGEYSLYRKRNHGNSSKDRRAEQFIVFSQNHDQIGNRAFGDRLTNLVFFESLKLAAGIVLLSPYIPLLFMGEEYGEDAPFLYFVSHSDKNLIEAVRKGRKEEFKAFSWDEEPPDPQSIDTFLKSKINWDKRKDSNHKILLSFYKHIIALRRTIPALSHLERKNLDVYELEYHKIVCMRRCKNDSHIFSMFNFNQVDTEIIISLPEGIWFRVLDSSDSCWNGACSLLPENMRDGGKVTLRAFSFVLYKMGGNV